MADFQLFAPSHLLLVLVPVFSAEMPAIEPSFTVHERACRLLLRLITNPALLQSRNLPQCQELRRPASQIRLLRRYPFWFKFKL